MSLIGSVSSFFQRQTPSAIELGNAGSIDTAGLGGAAEIKMPIAPHGTPSFGALLDHVVGEVNTKMEAGSVEQAKVLSGESTNLHQAMISMQEASVAFSLMVEVRNKMVESYQELMRMQV